MDDPTAIDDPPRPGVPTPGHAFGLFGAGFLALVFAAQFVEWLALSAIAPASEWAELTRDPARNPLLNDGLWIVALTAVPELALGLLLLAAVRAYRFSPRLVLPLEIPRWSAVVGALLLVFGVAPLADVIYAWLSEAPWVPSLFDGGIGAGEIVQRAVGGRGAAGLLAAILGLAVIPAVVEEAFFRGFVTAAFRGSDTVALVAPTVLFGLFHLDPAQAAATAVLGLAFGLARLCTGSLVASMAAHAAYNAAVLAFAYWSTGAGDETSLGAVLAGLVAAVVGLMLLVGRAPRSSPTSGAAADNP